VMINLESILLGLLVADAIALVVLILLQQGKGADVGAAFGSGGANTVFGGAGSASVLAKLTTWLAIGFFALSFGLAFAAKERAATLSDVGLPQISVPAQNEAAEAANSATDSGTEEITVDDVPNLDEAVDALESAPESSPSDVPDV
jgi:preprotein translocase subunit SecG